MFTTRTRLIRITAGATVALGFLALTGCANPIEQLVNRGAESAVEKLIEQGGGGAVDIDTKEGSITFGDGETSMNIGTSANLPEGWPDIPIPDGQITMSTKTPNGMQTVFDTTLAEVERVLDAYRNSGYETKSSLTIGEVTNETFTKDGVDVALQVYPNEDDTATLQIMVFNRDE